jgi:hypothetical protein
MWVKLAAAMLAVARVGDNAASTLSRQDHSLYCEARLSEGGASSQLLRDTGVHVMVRLCRGDRACVRVNAGW